MANRGLTTPYVGRFAPSPSGDLHLGSLFTALLSWLDAKAHHGRWLVRVEDIDEARTVEGSIDSILRCLESHHLHWDGDVVFQSKRHAFYNEALNQLRTKDLLFWCNCSRQSLKSSHGICLSKTCNTRRQPPNKEAPYSIRLLQRNSIETFWDQLHGKQDLTHCSGGFALVRRDGVFAYNFVVVIDDYLQGITHVVRGADLLKGTFAQLHIQQALGVYQPIYAHTPLLVNQQNLKLSKQNKAPPVDPRDAALNIRRCLLLLGLTPPTDCLDCEALLQWTLGQWSHSVHTLTHTREIRI